MCKKKLHKNIQVYGKHHRLYRPNLIGMWVDMHNDNDKMSTRKSTSAAQMH